MAKKKRKKNKKPTLTARKADKFVLYEQSVQAPEIDCRFLARYYKKMTGRPARVFREDFCGTAALSCWWVRLHSENRAIGVDLDAGTLKWARGHNVSRLKEDQRKRVRLIRNNVLTVRFPKVDIVAAMNFSYSVFKTRDLMRQYMRNAYRSLRPHGLLMMDAWGGRDTMLETQDRRRLHGFTYIWDQVDFDPVSHDILCKIHFEFRDGTKMRNAFIYGWRLWTLPEMQEIMTEAGFHDVHVLWEGSDRKTGEGNGRFRRCTRGGDEEAWIAYVVGRK
ncbi:MAG TPA: class I SAM-dependent methyltransferase [Vicinamibacteria bacterium]|jgi:SAM-dependent methyltransferase